MIKKALEYIVGLGEANVNEYVLPDGEKGLYSDKPLHRLETPIPVAEKLYLRTSKGEALIPNPVVLKPYRTFLEVDQPESAFIFRMKEGHGVECAIFEADGGAWMMEAMQNIKAYLEKELEGMEQFTVIA